MLGWFFFQFLILNEHLWMISWRNKYAFWNLNDKRSGVGEGWSLICLLFGCIISLFCFRHRLI